MVTMLLPITHHSKIDGDSIQAYASGSRLLTLDLGNVRNDNGVLDMTSSEARSLARLLIVAAEEADL